MVEELILPGGGAMIEVAREKVTMYGKVVCSRQVGRHYRSAFTSSSLSPVHGVLQVLPVFNITVLLNALPKFPQGRQL